MKYKFNPLTGNLDMVSDGGSGSSTMAKDVKIDPIPGLQATTVQGALSEMYLEQHLVNASVAVSVVWKMGTKSSSAASYLALTGNSVTATVSATPTKGTFDIGKLELRNNGSNAVIATIANPANAQKATFPVQTLTSAITYKVVVYDTSGNEVTGSTKPALSYGYNVYFGLLAVESDTTGESITADWLVSTTHATPTLYAKSSLTATNGVQHTFATGTTNAYAVVAIPNTWSAKKECLSAVVGGSVYPADGMFLKQVTISGVTYDVYKTLKFQKADCTYRIKL